MMHCFNATNVLINRVKFRKYFYSNFILKSSARLARPMGLESGPVIGCNKSMPVLKRVQVRFLGNPSNP